MADRIKMEVPFFQTPNNIYLQGLNIYELSVYIYLCRCGNNGTDAFPSYNDMAKKCGMSRRKAIDTINSLIKKELIIKYERDKLTNLYEVVTNLPGAQDAPPSAHGALPLVHEVHPPSAHGAPKKELYKKNNIKNIYTGDFLEWYSLYPNQFNKEQSFKNFKKLMKEDSFENLMTSTKNYIAYLKAKKATDKQYITRSTNFIGQKKEYLGYLEMDFKDTPTGIVESSLKVLENLDLEGE